MKTAAVAFVAAGAASLLATPVVRNLALRRGALDHALSSRKIHGRPVPRLGGVAMVLAFYASLLVLFLVSDEAAQRLHRYPVRVLSLLAGGAAIAALGVLDDLRGTGARTKFAVQFAVAAAMYFAGFRIDHVVNPLGGTIELGLLGLPFTMLWIAGVINALNLIDGLDGLAGGIAFIAIAVIFTLSVVHGRPVAMLVAGALGGAVLGFLVYNFNPASIFMGDTGSMFLGFFLAVSAIATSQKASTTAVALVVPIVALGIPIADTLLAMGRRAARGVPLFSADRGHIHHRLLDLGLTHRQTVLAIYGASIALGGAALVLARATPLVALACLAFVGLGALLVLRRLGFVRLDRAEELFEQRRRNLLRLSVIHRVGETLATADNATDVWLCAWAASDALGASAVALHLADADQDGVAHTSGFDVAGSELFRARFPLGGERSEGDTLELGWTDGRTTLDRDTEIAVELLCQHLSAAWDRVRPARPRRPVRLVARR